MSRWQDINNFCFDWGDDGRAIELRMADGTVVTGELSINDVVTETETPIFVVETFDGPEINPFDAKEFRMVGRQ